MTTAKRNTPGFTDSYGKTLDSERAEAVRVQTLHAGSGVNQHVRATVGRLWYSARRWGWCTCFEAIGRTGAYEVDGARFEIVEQV